jgi:hypothetical protein
MKYLLKLIFILVLPIGCLCQSGEFSKNPQNVVFHTEDITNFWKVFDSTYPKLKPKEFQRKYIDIGSPGLKGFIQFRIESGSKLTGTVQNEIDYYQSIRESSLSIENKKERFYECFNGLQKIYAEAVFPDVYFVIGRKNSGGTVFDKGLIIGAEMFGEETPAFKPILNIEYVDEVITHELIHFQQHYVSDNSLLAQCIREGSADFICELISGSHSNKEVYRFGEENKEQLWKQFVVEKETNHWTNWLYSSKDKSRPSDLGYWIGYKITQAYYNKATDKTLAIKEILNINNFSAFFEASGYDGQ